MIIAETIAFVVPAASIWATQYNGSCAIASRCKPCKHTVLPMMQPRLKFRYIRLSNKVAACGAKCGAVATHDRALIFDCDGVIVESEELHRISYNQCWQRAGLGFQWSHDFYEMLQNSVGGGKEKMRWYFNRFGWPDANASEEEREILIARLHSDKTELYKKLIETGQAVARPGVLRLVDEAQRDGYRLAICSAANASAVNLVLNRILGKERLAKFDLILAGDVVSKKKPDPMIYNVACERLGVQPENCVVIEDSQIGLQAALAAKMRVVITHTPYTASQEFIGAHAVYSSLGDPELVSDDVELVTIRTLFPDLRSL